MQKPSLLSEIDKYNLSPSDFSSRLDKYIFVAIYNLYSDGAQRINPIDVENYLSTNQASANLFKTENGIEYLQDAIDLTDQNNFSYYYKKMKKINLLNDLQHHGIDTKDFYIEDGLNLKAAEVNQNFETLEISDIIEEVKRKLIGIEKKYVQNEATETRSAFEGIDELLENIADGGEIGLNLQGDIFNEVCGGARTGCFYINSAASGVGKSRTSVANACYLAFPTRYNADIGAWEDRGAEEKVLYIATEQDFPEIQKMILAYLTDINEAKFRYGIFTEEEKARIQSGLEILEKYKENLLLVRMPDPSIELVKNIIRENCLLNEVKYVFYDYIFICPSLLREFKGFALRNDEILLMFSTALKDLSVELNIFIMSSTQLNANGDDNSKIRNESSLSGSRSIINKADFGSIMARPTPEELDLLKDISTPGGIIPNIVTDVYKNRGGQWTQIRIWSYFNLGTLKRTDLFVTDSRLNIIEEFNNARLYVVK